MILDLYDSEDSFRVLSPRITFPLATWGELFVIVRTTPTATRSGGAPDTDVIKLQAQVVW